MLINLKIANIDRLPNGGPLSYRSHNRNFEIGRENRDWTLPDPDKFISGRHCEVRYESGAFWLHDVSRNGTFVNGAAQRITNPHRLGDGDRLRIGRYIVSVSIEDDRVVSGATENTEGNWQLPNSDATDRRNPQTAGSFFAASAHPRVPGTYRNERQASPQDVSLTNDPFLASNDPAAHHIGQRSQAPAQIPHHPAMASGRSMQGTEILRTIAAGAGIPQEALMSRDPHEVALEIGSVLRSVVDELALLLQARAAAKVLAKSSHRTMVSATDNNPLKFVPGTEEILDIMFARRRAGYLDARHSIEDAFRDLKTHEFATYAAMQAALSRLLDDLSPDAIEKKLPASSFASRKARAWDAFVATWEAKEDAHENGMLDVFLAYFSEAYSKAAKPK
jgi:type VI secretion system protein ImpI